MSFGNYGIPLQIRPKFHLAKLFPTASKLWGCFYMKFKQENHRVVVRRTSNHRNQLSIDSNQLSLSRYSRRSKPLTNAIVVFVTVTFDPLSSINSVELIDHLLHSYIRSIDYYTQPKGNSN